MSDPWRIVTISGSLRRGSTNTALLATAAQVAPPGTVVTPYEQLAELPAFNPDDDAEPLHPAVDRLRCVLAEADAVLVSTPEYAGALPGSFKNLLDWTVGGGQTYRKPVAWVNVSSSSTGAANAHASLRLVLGYTGTDLVEAACAHIPVPRSSIGEDGTVTDLQVRFRLAAVLQELVARLAERAADPGE